MSPPRFRENSRLHRPQRWTEAIESAEGVIVRATGAIENLLSVEPDSSKPPLSQNNPQDRVTQASKISTKRVSLQKIGILITRVFGKFVKLNALSKGLTRGRSSLSSPPLFRKEEWI